MPNTATITVIYDDLTQEQPSKQVSVLNRLQEQTRVREQLIESGRSAEALEFEFTEQEFRAEVQNLAARMATNPFVLHNTEDQLSLLSPSQVLRIDVHFDQDPAPSNLDA